MEDLREFYSILMTLALAAHNNPDKPGRAMKACAVAMIKSGGHSKNMHNFLLGLTRPYIDIIGQYLLAARKVSEITEDSPLSYVLIKDEEGERWEIPNTEQQEMQ